jgi:hypothetical protein
VIPVVITQVQPQDLHKFWRFVRGRKYDRGVHATGLERIVAKVEADFIPEDIYVSIRTGSSMLYMVTRAERRLGFVIMYSQARPFSGKKELFLWCVYSLLLCERQESDNIPEAIEQTIEFIKEQARNLGCDSVLHLSSRPGFERWGFARTVSAWRLWLTPPVK